MSNGTCLRCVDEILRSSLGVEYVGFRSLDGDEPDRRRQIVQARSHEMRVRI